MKILIGQPIHEKSITQLEAEIKANSGIDMVLYPEGYLSDETVLQNACQLALKYKVGIITSYRSAGKDRAVIINRYGNKILERAKTLSHDDEKLCSPLVVDYDDKVIGYLLCMEILKGLRDLKSINKKIDFITHPIGVGMFSDEQFDLWINEAKNIAKTYNTMIIGTSHADGSYRNCGISLPISYFIDSDGEIIYVSKSDTRTRIVDLCTKEVEIIPKNILL